MNQRKLVRITGVFYLIIIICGLFSEGFVRMSLVVPGNAAETALNIKNSELLFRFGLIGDLLMVTADIIVAVAFYYLLKPVSEVLALVAAFFRLGQAAVIGMNLLNYLSPLLLLGTATEGIWSPEQISDQILFFMESHRNGYLISQVFFGFNCITMGYLLIKSPLFPRFLGIGVGLASIVYLAEAVINFLVPSIAPSLATLMIVPVIAELTLCFWLIFERRSIR